MKDLYWKKIWRQFCSHRLGVAALVVVGIFCLVGIYAPLLASSKPIVVRFEGTWFFPLFRYLFYTGFYTKLIDLFFNLMMFTFPVFLLVLWKGDKRGFVFLCLFQLGAFGYLALWPIKDPASDPTLAQERQEKLMEMRKENRTPSWEFDLSYMNAYARLNLALQYQLRRNQHERLQRYAEESIAQSKREWLISETERRILESGGGDTPEKREILMAQIEKETSQEKWDDLSYIPTLWAMEQDSVLQRIKRKEDQLSALTPGTPDYERAASSLQYTLDRQQWLQDQSGQLSFQVMPLLRSIHWEEDAGGSRSMNQYLPWWELTRINRKDLMGALIFGVRISLVVGLMAVGLAMMIGIPIGSLAGYYGGKLDILVCRLLEIWESMPTFFMLLLVVAITQSKSIFIVIAVVGLFGWTGFSRYIRGEFFKQRHLPYVEACQAMGFKDRMIIFSHILPNAIPPVLTLLPFSIMGAITSEAGLSFLGLGEEGSSSWGVLMDEGRSAFPGESYLLWPPAILLTLLLVAIALVGDAFRDALDPKMQK
jgi:peptide/nickel transport system permease protein